VSRAEDRLYTQVVSILGAESPIMAEIFSRSLRATGAVRDQQLLRRHITLHAAIFPRLAGTRRGLQERYD
jgi:hypothetical protein